MNFNLVTADIWFRRGLILITVCFAVLDNALYDMTDTGWLNAGFVVCMAGIVGYYTNYLAIKMLFQPKQGRVLGWEGLVPRNKAQIARSLGESVQQNLLAPRIIMEYIYERRLVENMTDRLAVYVDQLLSSEERRAQITGAITDFLREQGPGMLGQGFDLSEDYLKSVASKPDELVTYWHWARDRALEYISEQQNRRQVADYLSKLVLTELPNLAAVVNRAIDNYLAEKKGMAGWVSSLKKIASFDESAVRDLLQTFVDDPATGRQFMGMVDMVVDEFKEKLYAEETQQFVLASVERYSSAMADFARRTVLPSSISHLQAFLDDPANWQKIDRYITSAIQYVKEKLVTWVRSENGRTRLQDGLGRIVDRFDVTTLVEEQVIKLDTDELEKMILDNTGGNLVAIQFLGGILGLVAGSIQVNILAAIPVGALVLTAVISSYRNNRRYAAKKQQK